MVFLHVQNHTFRTSRRLFTTYAFVLTCSSLHFNTDRENGRKKGKTNVVSYIFSRLQSAGYGSLPGRIFRTTIECFFVFARVIFLSARFGAVNTPPVGRSAIFVIEIRPLFPSPMKTPSLSRVTSIRRGRAAFYSTTFVVRPFELLASFPCLGFPFFFSSFPHTGFATDKSQSRRLFSQGTARTDRNAVMPVKRIRYCDIVYTRVCYRAASAERFILAGLIYFYFFC